MQVLWRRHCSRVVDLKLPKGLAKLRNIVAETLMRMQMFPNLAARETCVAKTNFAARKQKMFLPGVQNIFASRTQILRSKHVSQFSHPGKHNKKHCFRKYVSLFSQALMMARERCQPMESFHEVILLRRGCHVPRDYTTFINTAVRNFFLYYVIQNKQKVVFGQVNTVCYLKYC